jgi:hypothetical protein
VCAVDVAFNVLVIRFARVTVYRVEIWAYEVVATNDRTSLTKARYAVAFAAVEMRVRVIDEHIHDADGDAFAHVSTLVLHVDAGESMARIVGRAGEGEGRGADGIFLLPDRYVFGLMSSPGRSVLPRDRRRRRDGEILVLGYLCHCGCLAKNSRSVVDVLCGTARVELNGSSCQFSVNVVAMGHLGIYLQMARHMRAYGVECAL